MKVSVVIPMREAAATVGEAVESILGQSLKDFECIVVDDDSSDESCALVDRFGDNRIILERPGKRLGFAGAINHGLTMARGEYIARMDADDIARPDRLTRQVEYLDQHPDIAVCGTWARTFGLGKAFQYSPPTDHHELAAAAMFDNPFIHPTVMMRRAILEQYSLRYDESFNPAEDYALWIAIMQHERCSNLPEVLLDYRIRKEGMSVRQWEDMDRQAIRIIRPQLQSLGLEPSELDLELHRRIGRGQGSRFEQKDDIEKAAEWLTRILDSNRERNIYHQEYVQKEVSAIWYRLCFHNLHLGCWILELYRGSDLGKQLSASVKDQMKLVAVAMKRKLLDGATPVIDQG